MDDLDENISSTGLEPLFIKEEEREQDRTVMDQKECKAHLSGVTFAEQQLKQSTLMKPYLQEMDELLKSCEELTGIPFGSHYSESYTEQSLRESSHSQGKQEVTTESYGETCISPQAYLSTSYIDTHMDGAGTVDQPAQDQSQSMGTVIDRRGTITEVSRQTNMPLTSAGNKLSNTMVEYEGQLLGMLAMLESCMEEAGMDFEPQDWVAEESQEYVQISKNHHLYRGTTLVPNQQERPLKSETQPMQLEIWPGERVEGDEVSEDSRNTMPVGSATNGSQRNPFHSCENMDGFSLERLQRPGSFQTDQGVLDMQLRFSRPATTLDATEDDPMYCEGMQTEYVFNEGTETKGEGSAIDVDDTELSAEDRHELKMDTTDVGSGTNELGDLGSRMEACIEEVERLEKRRRELLVEVLQLRQQKGQEEGEGRNEEEEETEERIDSKVAELMNILKREENGRREERKREIESLKEERAEEERRMWKVNVERQGLQEELRKLKRKLFAMARDCAHSQAALNNQRREMELLKREEEKLNSLVLQLTEEGSQLKSAQQQQLLDLQVLVQAQSSLQTSNTQEELTECRRHSCGDIQQYLQGGLKALEERYEPVLLALLKRREATAGALVKAKEQAQELRAQLGPLREEIQKLKLQKACLEEKLKLIHIHRREDVGQYKETVYFLEERSRELKMELKTQKRNTNEMEELRDRLTKKLLLYRAAIEDHNKCDQDKKT
ncbi:trichohyalin [Stegastes partitus]|uniref:Trichohyalin-like n=1 Tax=Stegastes partitus TaxID=144197 RepID=A0A3B5B265_9TELE|nr:PREDICTED: trichohyalin-like [Stegastes partitus]